MGKHAEYRALVGAAFLLASASAGAAECRLALALAFDVSRSVSVRDYRIQREGVQAALADPGIRAAFLRPSGQVALAVFEWSGTDQQAVVVDWVMVASEADIDRVAARIAAHERAWAGVTALGSALDFAGDLFARAPDCDARTLDVSGDGRNNASRGPGAVYARRDFGDLVVNGLAILGYESDISAYYAAEVIRGPGAFVERAANAADFPRAFRRKLERELAERVVGAAAAPVRAVE
jgi:hypothetical protein